MSKDYEDEEIVAIVEECLRGNFELTAYKHSISEHTNFIAGAGSIGDHHLQHLKNYQHCRRKFLCVAIAAEAKAA
jgi:hypothetical protein